MAPSSGRAARALSPAGQGPYGTMTAMAGPPLLERDWQLAQVDALLAAAIAGEGGALVVEGPAGIGKSALLAAARAAGVRRGMAVAAAAGSELERDFALGVARHLLEPLLAGSAPLAGPARLGAAALGLAGAVQAAPRDPFGVAHALYWLAADLAAPRPLLLVVDDLQWADAPSQRWLAYLARRLDGLPVALAVALRPPLPGEDRGPAEAIAAAPRTALARLAPLSEDAVGHLAAAALGASAPGVARACHAATGGTPLWVDAVLRALVDDPGDDPAARVAALGPDPVARHVLRRVDALAPDGPALTRAVAVLGDEAPLDVAAELADLPLARAAEAAGALAAADVLADALPLRFRHPVIRSAVLERLARAPVAADHARAARALAARGAPAPVVAAHLHRAAPAADPWAVARLRDAAAAAQALGQSAVAAGHLARALAEPPPWAGRPGILQALASAELAAGLPDGPGHAREAIAALNDPREQALAALELSTGLYERFRWPEARAILEAAVERLGDRDRELSLHLEAELATATRMDLGAGQGALARLERRTRGLTGATPAERLALAAVAAAHPDQTAAEHARVAELLDGVLDAGPLPVRVPETGVISNLIRAGRLEAAAEAIERRMAAARASGGLVRFAVLLQMRAWVALERGALADAEADGARAVELAREFGAPTGPVAASLAQILAERGDLIRAQALLEDGAVTGELPEHQVMNIVLFARAVVRLAQRRTDEALADLLDVGRRYAAWEIRRPVPPWRSHAAVLLAWRGDREAAERLAREELALARTWGAPVPLGVAERALGLVTGTLAPLERAVTALAASPARLELARAEVELGAAMRRARRRTDAREPLRQGMARARACGAAPLAERALDELRATGARPRRLVLSGADALTASERRVALLAARGRTNREIAQELFVTQATVETHLRHVFQKLGVHSRRELPKFMDAP
jgi:DNA-binding CsgD family transcriptional regulator